MTTIKIDTIEACDITKWDAILTAVTKMNLPEHFLNWIKVCIESFIFSFDANVKEGARTKPTKGIEQGFPIPLFPTS